MGTERETETEREKERREEKWEDEVVFKEKDPT